MLRLTRESVKHGFESRHQLDEVLGQILLMKSHATIRGTPLPSGLGRKIAELAERSEQSAGDKANIGKALELAFEVHGILGVLVKPATPESIEASAPRAGWARIQWPRITDILIAVTLVSLVLFVVGTALSAAKPDVVYYTQFSYFGAALLGAAFSGLYTAYGYVSSRTFDPAAGSSYMTRVVLGAISGLILADFGSAFLGRYIDNPALKTLTPVALALIGGYSADAVNLILKRVADTLVASVRGSSDDAIKAKQAQLEAESQTADLKQRQATLAALGQMLATVTDVNARTQIQGLMTAVGGSSNVSSKEVLNLSNVPVPIISADAVVPPVAGAAAAADDPAKFADGVAQPQNAQAPPPQGNGKLNLNEPSATSG